MFDRATRRLTLHSEVLPSDPIPSCRPAHQSVLDPAAMKRYGNAIAARVVTVTKSLRTERQAGGEQRGTEAGPLV